MKPTAHQVIDHSRRSVWPFTAMVVINWLVIVGIFWSIEVMGSHWWTAAAVLVLGTRQHALTVLGHEGTHFLIHANRRVNDLLANIFCFWPMGFDGEVYRRFHLEHHRAPGQARDPELLIKGFSGGIYGSKLSGPSILARFAKDCMGGALPELYFTVTRVLYPASLREFLAPVVLQATVLLILLKYEMGWVMVLWWLSYATSFYAFFRLRIWFEHTGIEGTHRIATNWWQKLVFQPHGIGYHYEHHNWPTVPFNKLALLRKLDTTLPVLDLIEAIALIDNLSPPEISSDFDVAKTR